MLSCSSQRRFTPRLLRFFNESPDVFPLALPPFLKFLIVFAHHFHVHAAVHVKAGGIPLRFTW
jgi:hypothetical protein